MQLLFNKCECDWGDLSRIPRSWWMRLFKSRRLYFCTGCQSRLFAHRNSIEGVPQWWAAGAMLAPCETRPVALEG